MFQNTTLSEVDSTFYYQTTSNENVFTEPTELNTIWFAISPLPWSTDPIVSRSHISSDSVIIINDNGFTFILNSLPDSMGSPSIWAIVSDCFTTTSLALIISKCLERCNVFLNN